MIVVDTNVLVGLVLATDWSAGAEKLLHDRPEWAAPLLWRSELRNVLATHVRLERISLVDALEAMATAEALVAGREFAVPSAAVLTRAEASGCSAYDCEFVVLSEDLDVPLVTNDRKLLAAFPDRALSLEAALAG